MASTSDETFVKNKIRTTGFTIVEEQRRYHESLHRKRIIVKEKEKLTKEQLLFYCKHFPSPKILSSTKPRYGNNCQTCIPQKSDLDPHELRKDSINILETTIFGSKQMDPSNWGIIFPHLSQAWRINKQNNKMGFLENYMKHKMFSQKFNGILVRPEELSWFDGYKENNRCIMFVNHSERDQDAELVHFTITNCLPFISMSEWKKQNSKFNLKEDLEEKLGDIQSVMINLPPNSVDEDLQKLFESLSQDVENKLDMVRVSLTYDKLQDNSNENYWSRFLSAKRNNGFVRVNFGEPFAFIRMKNKIMETNVSEQLGGQIIRHIHLDFNKTQILSATAILSFVLLYRFRDGASMEEIINFLKGFILILRDKVVEKFTDNIPNIVTYGSMMLGAKLISLQKNQENIIVKPVNIKKLYAYAKPVVALLAEKSIVATGLRRMLNEKIEMTYENLTDICNGCNEILFYENLSGKPCNMNEVSVLDSLNELMNEGVISKIETTYNNDQIRAQNIAKYFDTDSNSDEDSDYEDTNRKKEHEFSIKVENDELFNMYNEILKPMIEAYLVTFECKTKLSTSSLISKKEFVAHCMKNLTFKMEMEFLHYAECVSEDFVENCIKIMSDCILIDIVHDRGITLLQLNKEYKAYDNEKFRKICKSLEQTF